MEDLLLPEVAAASADGLVEATGFIIRPRQN